MQNCKQPSDTAGCFTDIIVLYNNQNVLLKNYLERSLSKTVANINEPHGRLWNTFQAVEQ